jgi:small subunit ribosomal protein S17e
MGRIKTQLIKRTTHKLVKEFPTAFSKEFGANKEIVSRYLVIKSKKVRNTIAGYVTRLMKKGVE